jgi:hypothetical protein
MMSAIRARIENKLIKEGLANKGSEQADWTATGIRAKGIL